MAILAAPPFRTALSAPECGGKIPTTVQNPHNLHVILTNAVEYRVRSNPSSAQLRQQIAPARMGHRIPTDRRGAPIEVAEDLVGDFC
jgi:hypothetical protein